MAQRLLVFADWQGLGGPCLLGSLHARAGSGREVFEFAFAASALAEARLTGVRLDPHLANFAGPQHAPRESANFGAFSDASPDRWGRLLMRRRLERLQRAGTVARDYRLRESDYLLGVHDAFRAGGLRFKLEEAGPFLDNQHGVAAPPFVRLRELEAAAQALEDERSAGDPSRIDAWLRMLVAPGGSLGGARPKASVSDENGHLWIAKFPSVQDTHDVGAWELVAHALAQAGGIAVAPAWARRFGGGLGGGGHTFAVKRFDRTAAGERLHFASAMTLTGRRDGDGAATGASYLDLARVLMEHGAQPAADLRQLWTRIVFNLLVSNTDDHLRNHGFLLVPGKGWRLAEAYDMNPVPDAGGLSLNISETDNARDLELARSVAGYFRVKPREAAAIIERLRSVVVQWPVLAKRLRIAVREQERLASAFALA
jgi:serine/threonine-protein kinase HipA